MTVVGRLQLDHPALGTAGGSGLHASITAIYQKIGDNIGTRILTALAVANAATATVEHDFLAPFAALRYDLFLYDTGTLALTQITDTTTPSLSQFAIAATSGFATSKIDITNSSGSTRDLVLVVDLDTIDSKEVQYVSKAVSSNVTLEAGKVHLVDTSAARSLALPNPATTKVPIWIKDVTGTLNTNNITVTRFGSENIDGVAASATLDSDNGSYMYVSNGTDWFSL